MALKIIKPANGERQIFRQSNKTVAYCEDKAQSEFKINIVINIKFAGGPEIAVAPEISIGEVSADLSPKQATLADRVLNETLVKESSTHMKELPTLAKDLPSLINKSLFVTLPKTDNERVVLKCPQPPIVKPTIQSAIQPKAQPTVLPSVQPEVQSTVQPTVQPAVQPSVQPDVQPADQQLDAQIRAVSEMPPNGYKIGQEIKTIVTCCDENSKEAFFISRDFPSSAHVTESISKMTSSIEKSHVPKHIKVGDSVFTKSVDDCWYRAVIMDVSDKKTAQVRYVDYGNHEVVSRDRIRRNNVLELSLTAIPEIAVRSVLNSKQEGRDKLQTKVFAEIEVERRFRVDSYDDKTKAYVLTFIS